MQRAVIPLRVNSWTLESLINLFVIPDKNRVTKNYQFLMADKKLFNRKKANLLIPTSETSVFSGNSCLLVYQKKIL